MKNIVKIFLLSSILAVTSLFAEIIETHKFSDILKYSNAETLVLLDIDDTILVPAQTLGTDVWFQHRLNIHRMSDDYEIALDKALAEWEAIRHLTQMQLVENDTPEMISLLQQNNIATMGLTTQGLALATRTINQLKSFQIDLSTTAPSENDHYFINKHGVLYRHGVLFTSGTLKGPAIMKLLELMNFHPEHIVFINDKLTHLKDVEKSLVAAGIQFTGLRYTRSDERVANFDPKIADIQWSHSTFNHILSDEEAEALIEGLSFPAFDYKAENGS